MSYEGYTQALCAKGHLNNYDCNESDHRKCCVKGCKELIVWRNMVNTTNGSYEGKKRIDGCVRLRMNPIKVCKCKKCGNEHLGEPITFKIPAKRGQKVL